MTLLPENVYVTREEGAALMGVGTGYIDRLSASGEIRPYWLTPADRQREIPRYVYRLSDVVAHVKARREREEKERVNMLTLAQQEEAV